MEFDTQLLEQIAATTGGKFYRAFSEKDLEQIYAEIDRLEKTKIELSTIQRSTDYFHWLIGAGVLLLLFELLVTWGILRAITP